MGIFTNKKNRKASKIKIKKTLKRNKSGARKMRGGSNPAAAALVAKIAAQVSAAASSVPGAQSAPAAPAAPAFDPKKVAAAIRIKKDPRLAIQENIAQKKKEGKLAENNKVQITSQMIAQAIQRAKVVTEDAKKINPEAYQVMKQDIHSTMFFDKKTRKEQAAIQVKKAKEVNHQKKHTGRFNVVPKMKF